MSECNSFECNSIELTNRKNRKVILNRAKYYYENDKERLRKQARDKYKNLSEEEKNKEGERERESMEKTDTAMCLKKKQRLKEYQKSYCEAIKSQYNNK